MSNTFQKSAFLKIPNKINDCQLMEETQKPPNLLT